MTDLTFADYLKPILKNVPREIIDQASIEKLNTVGSHLPGKLAFSLFIFELPLYNNNPHVDLLISIRRDSPGIQCFCSDKDNTYNLGKQLLESQTWINICEFMREWRRKESDLYHNIFQTWLEFDMDTVDPELPVPNLFFGIKPDVSEEDIDICALVISTLDRLAENKLSRQTYATLKSCFAHLPENAKIIQIGLMSARTDNPIRLCVHDIQPDDIDAYLNSIQWPGSPDDANNVVHNYGSMTDKFCLAIDVNETVGDRLGFESYFTKKQVLKSEPRWNSLIHFLIKEELCISKKGEAVLRFPDFKNVLLLDDNNSKVKFFSSIAARGLHHIKYVINPGRPLEVKAYFWARFINKKYRSF